MENSTKPQLDPNLVMGAVTLSVADLSHSLDYYQKHIGLKLLKREGDSAELGAGNTHLLTLKEIKNAMLDKRASGLYHFALLLPSRVALAQTIHHFSESRTPIGGSADHHVSEALYLNDPDGHGLEIYRDRPRDKWTDANGDFYMSVDPLLIHEIMAELDSEAGTWQGLDAGTVMGHVHLQVRDEREAEAFYTDILGFDHMIHYPQAAFVSAGGYHHHLGMNSWHSRGRNSAPNGSLRLEAYEIILSDGQAFDALGQRLEQHHIAFEAENNLFTFNDPSGNTILIRR